MEPGYRSDIDGLRALSLISILLFHARFEWASGGYVGVDVFFVISGFLITRNIRNEIGRGSFSFSHFYTRRVRRLYPAIFVTFAATMALGWLVFSPAHFARLGNSLVWAIVSASNFFFWNEADYFSPSSEIKPLLHTWSLSLEEQFYLIWPALVVGLASFEKRWLLPSFFAIAGGLSLLSGLVILSDHPEAAFFLLPFRIIEFSFGALCLWLPPLRPDRRLAREALVVAGLGMILWSIGTYSEATAFPGYAVILPCLGAAFVIYAGRSSVSDLVLSNRVVVKIGLISYSVYLIHWPMFVYYGYWKFEAVGVTERIGLLLASLLLGHLMWKFIEQPFRYKKDANQSRFFLAWAASSALVLALLAANVWGHAGWPDRVATRYAMSKAEKYRESVRYSREYAKENPEFYRGGLDRETVIVMGNSHATDLMYALRENGSRSNFVFLRSGNRCFNFGSPRTARDTGFCRALLEANLADGAWATSSAVYLHDHWPDLDIDDLEARLKAIRKLTKAPLYVFGPKMIYEKPVPRIVRHSQTQALPINEYARKFAFEAERLKWSDEISASISALEIEDVHYVDVLRVQCGPDASACEVVSPREAKFLYFDAGHFTVRGSREFGARLKAVRPELF